MEKWQYKVTRVILSNQISFNETQNEANDKINNKQLIEFNNIGENGWELVQIMPRSKEDKLKKQHYSVQQRYANEFNNTYQEYVEQNFELR